MAKTRRRLRSRRRSIKQRGGWFAQPPLIAILQQDNIDYNALKGVLGQLKGDDINKPSNVSQKTALVYTVISKGQTCREQFDQGLYICLRLLGAKRGTVDNKSGAEHVYAARCNTLIIDAINYYKYIPNDIKNKFISYKTSGKSLQEACPECYDQICYFLDKRIDPSTSMNPSYTLMNEILQDRLPTRNILAHILSLASVANLNGIRYSNTDEKSVKQLDSDISTLTQLLTGDYETDLQDNDIDNQVVMKLPYNLETQQKVLNNIKELKKQLRIRLLSE